MLYVGFNPREITAYDFIGDFKKWPFGVIDKEKVKELLGARYVSCCTKEQGPILDIIERRLGIHIDIPFTPDRHRLKKNDRVLIIVVANLRKLSAYERYTLQEMTKARIFFRIYRVTS
ncbi:MAG: hypothetical protein AAB374_02420 [Patescibacteria group bacterium]